jgi:LysM repeat protein
MDQINQQSNEVFGKSIRELEKHIGKSKGISVIAAQLKDRFIPLGIVLLFIIMLAVIWSLKSEVSSLQTEVSQLNNDNRALKEQIDAQAKEVLPVIKTSGDKGTEAFISHVVQEGDCFATISERYYQADDYASELAKLNGLTINSTLQIGQIIKVPKNKADLKKEM